MTTYLISTLRETSENWGISKNDLLSYINPEDDLYDPTFPKPFSRENKLYWDDDEMIDWEDFRSKLKELKEHRIILFLK